MTDDKRSLKVFLCHAHSDRDAVKALYARLKREGVDVWLDKEKLLPGADWEYEIRKAVREADVAVVCLSKQFNQAGFRQKEVRIALDAAMEKPEGEIFIIPARLEECDNLESLSRWHWVDLFEEDGYQRLLLALRARANKIGAALRQRGRATVSRPKLDAEQEAAQAKAKLEAEELEKRKARESAEKARLESEEAERQRLAREKAEKDAQENAGQASSLTQPAADLPNPPAQKAEETERQRLAKEQAERRKTPRKPNTAVMVGGIGLVGLIFVAIIASLSRDLFAPAPTQTPTYQSPITNTPAPAKTPAKAFTPTAAALPTEITDEKGAAMRLVPAGEFEMGSERYDDEKPIHQVYLDAFYMDKYEVTNALYKACVDAGGCTPPQNTSRYNDPKYENHPVVYVDWYQSQACCEWRGASLPAEAQWEKAARGTDGRTYPWGEGIDCGKANYSTCKGDTTPVGSYESGQSPYGIYDLAGNVWEWTADWYSETYYQISPAKNPLGPESGTYRVLRGGSWSNFEYNLRVSNRGRSDPDVANVNIGFRCLRSLP